MQSSNELNVSKKERTQLLNDLVVAKFGSGRGNKAAACRAVDCPSSVYFYNMLSGAASPSRKIIAALEALSDYVPPPRIVSMSKAAKTNRLVSPEGDYVVTLSQKNATLIEGLLLRANQPLPITDAQITKLFPHLLAAYLANIPAPAEAPEPDAFD